MSNEELNALSTNDEALDDTAAKVLDVIDPPDPHAELRSAVNEIYKALQNNAAPMNLRHALGQVEMVQINSDLLTDLFNAYESCGLGMLRNWSK